MPDRSQLIWLFFRFSGRVNRAAYFLAGLLAQLLPAFFLYRFTLVPEGSQAAVLLSLLFLIGLIVGVWANLALAVKRLHDFDKPGIIAAVLFIPFVSIAAYLALCLFPGNTGPNRFGAETNAPA